MKIGNDMLSPAQQPRYQGGCHGASHLAIFAIRLRLRSLPLPRSVRYVGALLAAPSLRAGQALPLRDKRGLSRLTHRGATEISDVGGWTQRSVSTHQGELHPLAAAGEAGLGDRAGQLELLLHVFELFPGQEGPAAAIAGEEVEFLEDVFRLLLVQSPFAAGIHDVEALRGANVDAGAAPDARR